MSTSAVFYKVESVERSGYRWCAILSSLAVLMVALVGLTGCDSESREIGNSNPTRVAEVKQAFRDLWVGHIYLIRHVATNDVDERDVAEKEVAANSKLIAHTMKQFYGDAVSDKLCRLLNSNYSAIREYSEATVAGNKARQDVALALLESNTNDIADLLSRANPYLRKDTIQGLIAAHGAHQILQVNLYKERKYARLMATWPTMRKQGYVIADALTSGLVRQFPDRFS